MIRRVLLRTVSGQGFHRSTTAMRTQQQSSSPHLLFEVRRHGAQLLLDVADDLTLSNRGEAVSELRAPSGFS